MTVEICDLVFFCNFKNKKIAYLFVFIQSKAREWEI